MTADKRKESKKKGSKSERKSHAETAAEESVEAMVDSIEEAAVVAPTELDVIEDPAPEPIKDSAPVAPPAPVTPKPEPVRRVVLKNLRNKAVTFDLPHEVYCAGARECFCEEQDHRRFTENMKERKEWVVTRRLKICASVSIGPRGESRPLHPAALECSEIDSAIRSRPARLIATHRVDGA